MKFWQIDGGNMQQGFSFGTYSTHFSSSSNTPSTEESPYFTKDVKIRFIEISIRYCN